MDIDNNSQDNDQSVGGHPSQNGLDDLSAMQAPESAIKKDKKKKKKKDKGEKKLKVKNLFEGQGDGQQQQAGDSDEDIDNIIQQQRNKFDGSDAGSQMGFNNKPGHRADSQVNLGASADLGG